MAFLRGINFKNALTGQFYEKDYFLFQDFPKVDYDFEDDGKTIAIRNFLKRFGYRESVRNNIAAYSHWIVREEDTPFTIAHHLYESTHLYWVILYLNQILDPVFDWPLTDRELYRFVEEKYGVDAIYEHHHYEAKAPTEVEDYPEGIIVDSTYPYKDSVSNYGYEFHLNDDRRNIKLLKPEFLSIVMDEWNTIKNSGFTEVIS